MAEIAPALTAVGRIVPQRGWTAPRHVHRDHHELIVVVAGACEVRTRGGVHRARAGQVLLYLQGFDHAERSIGRFESFFLGWRGFPERGFEDWPVVISDRHGRFNLLVRWLWELRMAGEKPAGVLCSGLLAALLRELRDLRVREIGDLVEDTRRRMREHLAEPLTLDDLARGAKLSKFHFLRRFKAATGETPMAHLRRLRVETARNLLVTTALPLKAIAAQVGFADEFALSRVCKRLTGVPPSAWRA